MKLTEQEIAFLKSIKSKPFLLSVRLCSNPDYSQGVDTAEALEDKGLCNTSFSVSKGFSAAITDKGKEVLKTL